MVLLGIDLGSSSIKASLLDSAAGRILASSQYPKQEMTIHAPQPGWAEQDPNAWWDATGHAVRAAINLAGIDGQDISAIGIAYQMHGLVCLDKQGKVLRPSIIWCDSRAVPVGDQVFKAIGPEQCLKHLLNSPGNFTAAKLAWVKQNEPEVFEKIKTICLPGDYLAAQLTGKATTTISGLSEGIFWDFKNNEPAAFLLEHLGIDASMLAECVPTFGDQGRVTPEAAAALGLKPGTPVTYRAGDQPNNALSLNVLEAGEIAATAGTSGVVYGVSDRVQYDPPSRINSFAHVNHSADNPRLGLLLCINGTGITNAWTRRLLGDSLDYQQLNDLAGQAPVGCDGLTILPFGNGAERMLGNRNIGAQIFGIDFNRHKPAHVARAAQEGIVFSFRYGIDIMREVGVQPDVIRAGRANMFLSPLFRQMLATISGARIELYETDGSIGAARGAGIGVGAFASAKEAFESLHRVGEVTPDASQHDAVEAAYQRWHGRLESELTGQR